VVGGGGWDVGKFDGMDPESVRGLLAELKRAAKELRAAEERVNRVMGAAGLATRTTHRPTQVVESIDSMIRDVTARLALLEKREEERKGGGTGKAPTPAAEAVRPEESRSREPRSTDPPETPPKPDEPRQDAPRDSKDSGDGKDPEADTPRTPKEPEDSKTDAPREPKNPEADAPRGPKHPEADAPRGPKEPEGAKAETPVREDPRRDEPPRESSRPAETSGSEKNGDDPGRPQVVEVGGVKVLQVPLDPATADEIADLLDEAEDVRPQDLPELLAEATRPTQVEPAAPLPGREPDVPVPDKVGPALDTWEPDAYDKAAIANIMETLEETAPDPDRPGRDPYPPGDTS
jgi:hypothetical protein